MPTALEMPPGFEPAGMPPGFEPAGNNLPLGFEPATPPGFEPVAASAPTIAQDGGGFLSRMVQNLVPHVGVGSAPSPMPALDNPLAQVDPTVVSKLLPDIVTELLGQKGNDAAGKELADTLSGLTSPSSVGLLAAAPLAPALSAGAFAGLGAKLLGESLGGASVAQETGNKEELGKQGMRALLALGQASAGPLHGLSSLKGRAPEMPGAKVEATPTELAPLNDSKSLAEPLQLPTPNAPTPNETRTIEPQPVNAEADIQGVEKSQLPEGRSVANGGEVGKTVGPGTDETAGLPTVRSYDSKGFPTDLVNLKKVREELVTRYDELTKANTIQNGIFKGQVPYDKVKQAQDLLIEANTRIKRLESNEDLLPTVPSIKLEGLDGKMTPEDIARAAKEAKAEVDNLPKPNIEHALASTNRDFERKSGGPPMLPPKPPKYTGPTGEDLGGHDGGSKGERPPVIDPLPPTFKQKLQQAWAKAASYSAPKTTTIDKDIGTRLIEYANSRAAAEATARSMATDVMGPKGKTTGFSQRLGAVLVEDSLRGLKKAFERAGDKESAAKVTSIIGKGPLESEKDLLRAYSDPDISASIVRHKEMVQAFAEKMHKALGGKMAEKGDVTDAFINLKAVLGEAGDTAAKDFVFGNSKNDPLAQLKRKSVFNRQRKGTAQNYETDYRKIAERMIRGNYVENAKQALYKSYVDKGYGKVLELGEPAPTISGMPTVAVKIQRKGVPDGSGGARTLDQNLWVRKDLAPELNQALQLRNGVDKQALHRGAEIFTKLQTELGVDALTHMANQTRAINQAVRAKGYKNVVGVQEVDTLARISKNIYKALQDSPATQRELAQIATVSSGRVGSSPSILGKLHPSLDKISFGHLVNFSDKVGRLALNDMYNDLVKSGHAQDTVIGRSRFIEQMGQYNPRLMSHFQQTMKKYGLSPFVVAGQTFNSLALKRMVLDPSVEATSPATVAKMQMNNLVSLLTTVAVTPAIINLYKTGSITGRPGTPIGAIDTGKDDANGKHVLVDMAEWAGLRRGMRNTGVNAIIEGNRKGQKAGQIATHAANDILHGLVHSWWGPGMNAGQMLMTGEDMGGFNKAKNKSIVERVKSTGEMLNPTVGAVIKGKKEGKSTIASLGGILERTAGVKHVGLSLDEQAQEVANRIFHEKNVDINQLTFRDKVKLAKELQAERPALTPAERKAMTDHATEHTFERIEDLQNALPQRTKDFFTRNKLNTPGFKTSQAIQGETVTMTPEERDYYFKQAVDLYPKVIDRFEKNHPEFDKKTQQQKDMIVSRLITESNKLLKKKLDAQIKSGAIVGADR